MDTITYEKYKTILEECAPDIQKLKSALNISKTQEDLKKLEEIIAAPNFWDDMNSAQTIMQQAAKLRQKLERYQKLSRLFEDAQTLFEMAQEDDDTDILQELKQHMKRLQDDIQRQTLQTLLSGEFDDKNAIITLHAGAGGTEAMDWVQMLYRMYARFCEKHGFKIQVLDFLDGEEAGLKSISFLVQGENAYGYLKSEVGVHRLVRVSPFDTSGRRHTSFASLEAIPEIDDTVDVQIREEDLRIDTYRSSGAGGQHVNKTSSAVRITHLPTGIVTACQNERSQLQNKTMAMKMLKSKLVEIKERENLERIEDIKGDQKEIAWGSQIRSYVFMPYTLVKDHRTNYENGNVQAVMDGDLDGFVNAYLIAKSKEEV